MFSAAARSKAVVFQLLIFGSRFIFPGVFPCVLCSSAGTILRCNILQHIPDRLTRLSNLWGITFSDGLDYELIVLWLCWADSAEWTRVNTLSLSASSSFVASPHWTHCSSSWNLCEVSTLTQADQLLTLTCTLDVKPYMSMCSKAVRQL